MPTDNVADSPHNQRYHDHHTVGHGLRNPRMESSAARPNRHHLLPHSARPEFVEDSFRGDVAEVDKGRAMAAVALMVYHRDDECLQFCEGKRYRATAL